VSTPVSSSESSELDGVSLLPVLSSGRSGLLSGVTLDVQTSAALTGSGQTSHFSVLVDTVADPVDSGVLSDDFVGGVDHDDLEVFVGGVLTSPVRVEDSKTTNSSADSLFGDISQISGELELDNTLTGGLTVDYTLGDGFLSAASSNSDSVDNVTLLLLVSQSSGFIRSGGSGASVDGGQLSELPSSDSENEAHDIRLLSLPKLFKIFVGTHF